MYKTTKGKRAFLHLVLILGAVIMIVPFVWMLLTSVKSMPEATSMNPFIWFSQDPQWSNYQKVWEAYDFPRLYFNTFVMIAVRVFCALLFSSMAAYAFARLEFPGRNLLFNLVLFQMMIPVQIFIIPQYLMIDKLHARNTIFALIFPGLVSAFGTFLLRQFFMKLPKEIEESAIIDGCNPWQVYFRIMLPLVRSGLAALGIFTALFAFKDLMWPLIVNTKDEAATLASALAKIQGSYVVDYPALMSAGVLAVVPMIIIYIIFQKQITEGIATTGGKL